ncbi:hypothetical protein O181_057568 [Austropuccinia psidii MF-1]|uniref:hAT-like transposase RNase-H fold domain-containing protein n=1 Tax=Austropuccinia psidii MF-1 TaxID=1389203 RepID=A0A9Q3HUM1_9BASI|nr:hypothetical protein [Austropuccinia psidii MF-1]
MFTLQVLSLETLKTALIYFISECHLPISITESSAFQSLLELCNPFALNLMVCRTALTAHLSQMFFFHQEHICKLLLVNGLFISFTTDNWTSPNVTAFIAVTAHFMDEDYKLTSLLLGLSEIIGDHSGASLAKVFFNIISWYNLNQHILCITTDNASVNNHMNQGIQSLHPTFTANTQAIGFRAQTIHLAARDVLNALGNAASDALDSSIASDPIPQRREKFITTFKLVYDDSRPTHATMLLSHVPTRWNSTYDMLNQSLTLKEAYNQFTSLPNLASYQLNVLEWDKVRVMVDFLHPLYEATQIICGEDYPTINHALPLYIMLLKRISEASNQHDISPMEQAISAMNEKLSKYLHLLLQKTPVICASILDPHFKLKFFIVHEATLACFGTTENQCLLCFKEQAKNTSSIHLTIVPNKSV